MPLDGEPLFPDADNESTYRAALARQQRLYRRMAGSR